MWFHKLILKMDRQINALCGSRSNKMCICRGKAMPCPI
jgi:hypothetical protein